MEQEVLLKIGVDSADVPKAINATKALEKQIELLARALDEQRITQRQSSDGLSKIVSQYRGMGVNALEAQNRVNALNLAVRENIAAAKQAAAIKPFEKALAQDAQMAADAAEHYNRALLGVAQSAKSARESAAAMSELFKEQARVEQALTEQARAFGEAVREAHTYATANKSAADSAEVFARELQGAEQVMRDQSRAFGEAVVAANTYVTANKSAADSASVFVDELRRQEAQLAKSARSQQDHMRQLQQANLANKSAADSAEVFTQQIARQEREVEQLAMKYKPLYAASKQYERAISELDRAHEMGVLSTRQHENAVERLRVEYEQFVTGTAGWENQFVQGGNRSARSVNRFGMYAQQVGYQVGDFFVQVQSGTNAFVAFGQQATQLAGLLPGLAGAIVGIGISVATTFLAAWSRTREELSATNESVKKLEDGLKSLDETVQDWLRTKRAAELGITVEELTGVRGIEQAEKSLREARSNFEKFRNMVTSPGYGAAGGINIESLFGFGPEDKLKDAEAKMVAAQNRLNLLRQKQAEDRRSEYLEEMRTLEQQIGVRERILRFGEDSLEVLREQNMIEKANYAQQVALSDLTDRQKIDLIAANNAVQDMALNHDVLQRGVAATNSLFENIANTVMENIKKANEESIEAQKNGFELVVKIKDELTAAAKVNLAKVFTDATGPAQTVLRTLNSFVENARIAAARIEYERKVGGGRGLGPQGPTNEELVRNVPEVQLAYGRLALTTPDTTGGTGGGGGSTGLDAVQQLDQQIARTRDLLKLNSEQATIQKEIWRITDALGEDANKYSDQRIANLVRENLALQEQQRVMEEAYERQQSIYDQMSSSMEDAFMSIVEGTSSAKDAFRTMAYEIIKELYRVLVVQRMVGSFNATTGVGTGIVGLIGRALTNANGNAFIGGNVTAFANGGVVGGPTMFPMSGGRTGLMGEAGPEAIMPLKRTSSGKLGVVAEGGGGVVVNQTINVDGGANPATIRQEMMKMMPQFTAATTAAVIDARRRGGQIKAAFS